VARKARLLRRSAVLAALATVCLGGSASANHSGKDLITIGPAGGNGVQNAFFDATSADGSVAVFETAESLVPSDTDTAYDIYQRVGASTTLLSTGPSGGNGPNDVFFDGASDDATHVIFDTDERLVAGDTDSSIDVYERVGGTTTLVSTGSAGGNGPNDVTFDGVSRNGAHVFFETDESLVPADTDGQLDIYDRSGGTTTLVTTGPTAGGGGGNAPVFDDSSSDGSHVFFETDEGLVSGDTDGQFDVYERSGGTTSLVSTGPTGGNNNAFSPSYEGSSRGGTRVFFSTAEPLVSGDTDTQFDVYERTGGTTSLVSTGPTGGNGSAGAFFDGNSGDGAHVFFHTIESLVATDTDAQRDVYDRSGGTTSLVSTGSTGGNGAVDAFFDGSSLDGARVWFDTAESLVAADTDTRADVYERSGGATTRVSTGTNGGNAVFDAFFAGASLDGTRVFFTTAEKMEASDTDGSTDVYELFNGNTTQISIGPAGGNAAIGAFFDAASADGTRVFFNTRESLIASDTDAARDSYVATVTGYPRPKAASPLRSPFVIAYEPCTVPNRTHGPPLVFGSCNPPVQSSAQLTVGTADVNGKVTNSVGSVRYDVIVGNPSTPADEADVHITVNITDVRKKSDLSDYTGELQLAAPIEITDRNNAVTPGGGTDSATGDADLPATVPCVPTVDTSIGSACSLSTTLDAISPGTVVEGKRAVWALGKINLFDGGSDGVASTSPNTLFATEGLFIP
jgi:hypothetical protein